MEVEIPRNAVLKLLIGFVVTLVALWAAFGFWAVVALIAYGTARSGAREIAQVVKEVADRG